MASTSAAEVSAKHCVPSIVVSCCIRREKVVAALIARGRSGPARVPPSTKRVEEGQEVGQVAAGQLGVKSLGHDRLAALLQVLDPVARDADLVGVGGVQEDRLEGLARERAAGHAAV